MKPIDQWKNSTTLTTVFWAITAALSISAYAATGATRQAAQASALETLLPGEQNDLQLAQGFPNNCAEVVPPSGLYVRREPSVYSEAIGIVEYRSYLTTEEGGSDTWLPISAPLKGYVWRAWVAPCHVVPEVPPAVPEVEAVPGVEF
jgi:hypothetical protein